MTDIRFPADPQSPALSLVLAMRAPPRRAPVLIRLYRAGRFDIVELGAGLRVSAGLDALGLDRWGWAPDVALMATRWGRARRRELQSLADSLGPGPAWAVLIGVAGLDLSPGQLDRALSLRHGRALGELCRALGAAARGGPRPGLDHGADGTIHRG